ISYTVKDTTGLQSAAATVSIDYPQDPLHNTSTLGEIAIPNEGSNNYISEEQSSLQQKQTPYTFELSEPFQPQFNYGYLPENNPVGMEGLLKDQFVTDGKKTYDAGNKFSHTDNENLSYESVQSDGKPLPSFVTFDAETGQFTFDAEGAKASDVPSVLIRVVAEDQQGNQASSTFQVRFDQESSEADATSQSTSDTDGGVAEQVNTTDGLQSNINSDESPNGILESRASFDRDNATDDFETSEYTTSDINPLRLVGILENQFLMAGEHEYKIPQGAFEHTDPNENLTYTATLEDGSPLPDFMSFNADSQSFVFDADAANKLGVEKMIVKVIAEDSNNNKAIATFDVNFYDEEEELEKAKLEDQQNSEPENQSNDESTKQKTDVDETNNEEQPETEGEQEDDEEEVAVLEDDFSDLLALLGGAGDLNEYAEVEEEQLADATTNRAKHSLSEQVKQAGFFGYQQDKGQLLADLESVFKNAKV
ncbi:MAG: hypothetical protein GQ569_02020, partial [Methylococcaceae bacterium]|nr:hypothetical protein [Methylococcaceae bacterium]